MKDQGLGVLAAFTGQMPEAHPQQYPDSEPVVTNDNERNSSRGKIRTALGKLVSAIGDGVKTAESLNPRNIALREQLRPTSASSETSPEETSN